MIGELKMLAEKRQRSRSEPKLLQSELVASGFKVIETRNISRIVPSPFPDLRLLPMLYEIRVTYQSRRGCWYVRTGADELPAEWVWQDEDGNNSSPLPNIGKASAVHLVPVSWAYDWLVVGGSIFAGVTVTLWVLISMA